MADKLVYGTAVGSTKGRGAEKSKTSAYTPSAGPLKVRLETKGRGGKAVTVLFNLPFPSEAEAVAIMKELQASLGCGATFKDGQIELRGDVRERIEGFFAKRGVKLVRAGG